MTDIAERYARAAHAFADTIAAVPPERWDAPSPCEGWSALDLVEHLVDSHRLFLGLVGRELRAHPPVAEDPAGAFAVARQQVRADLEDPAAAAATYEGRFGEKSFAWAVDTFLSFDLVVHRWDLARTTGQDARIPPDEVARCLRDAHAWGEMARAPGVLGPALDPPDDADEHTRLLAFLGRQA